MRPRNRGWVGITERAGSAGSALQQRTARSLCSSEVRAGRTSYPHARAIRPWLAGRRGRNLLNYRTFFRGPQTEADSGFTAADG